jgi:hypothetical protein
MYEFGFKGSCCGGGGQPTCLTLMCLTFAYRFPAVDRRVNLCIGTLKRLMVFLFEQNPGLAPALKHATSALQNAGKVKRYKNYTG